MENMQDILKKYYNSGGKDLFKEQDDKVKDIGVNSHNPINGPTYSFDEIKKKDPALEENLKTRWSNEVPDGSSLYIKEEIRKTNQFKYPLDTIKFRNYASGSDFDDSESFLLELLLYKYFPDLNEFGTDTYGYLGSKEQPVEMQRKSLLSNMVPAMIPCIQIVAVSSAVEVFDALLILKTLKDFMEKDHTERRLPRQEGKVHFYRGNSQGKGARAVLNAAKKIGMPIK